MSSPNDVLQNKYFKTVHEEFDEVYDQLSTQIHPNNSTFNTSHPTAPTNVSPITGLGTWQFDRDSSSNFLPSSTAFQLLQNHQSSLIQSNISPDQHMATEPKRSLLQSPIDNSDCQDIIDTMPITEEPITTYGYNTIESTRHNISHRIDYNNYIQQPITKRNQPGQIISGHSLHENPHVEETYSSNISTGSKATNFIEVYNNEEKEAQDFQTSFTHSVVYEHQKLDQDITPKVTQLVPIPSQVKLPNVNRRLSTENSLWTPTTPINYSGPNCSTNDYNQPLGIQLNTKFTTEHLQSIKLDKWDSVCEICNANLANYCEFVKHFDRHQLHRNTRRYHKCVVPVCPMSIIGFKKKSSLRHHTHEYHFYRGYIVDEFLEWEAPLRQLLYTCLHPGCAKAFYRRDSLTRHTRLLHENPQSIFNKRLAVRIQKDSITRMNAKDSSKLESP
jgi:hypothetical protein